MPFPPFFRNHVMMNHAPERRNALSRQQDFRFSCFFKQLPVLLVLLAMTGCALAPDDLENADSPAAGMVRLAEQLRTRGDYRGAADFYTRATQRDPDSMQAHRGLADVYEHLGLTAEAANEYRAVLKHRPDDLETRRNLGRVLLAMEQPAEARDAYAAALELDSHDTKALNGMAVALDHLGEHEKAQKYYEKVLQQDPDNLATINNLAYSNILSGNSGEAVRLLEPHLKSPGATTALRQNLALAYGLSGMMADAERVAKMDLPPQKVKEALAYYKSKRAEKAVTTAPYAELGTYATEALAETEIHKMQAHIDEAGVDLKPVITPQVAAPGGTPRFAVRMMGCAKPDDVGVFCDQLAKHNIPCVIRK